MQHCVGQATVGVEHRLGKEHRILVGKQAQVRVQIGLVGELHRAQTPPTLKVLGDRQRQPRAERAEGDVGHEVHPQTRHPGDSGVFDSGVFGAALPPCVRGQNDPTPLDSNGNPVSDDDLGEADPRDVAVRDNARQQVQPAVWRAPAAGVEYPHGLERVARFGGHDNAEAGQGVRDGGLGGQADQPFTPEPSSDEVKCFWNATNSATAGAARTTAPARIAP